MVFNNSVCFNDWLGDRRMKLEQMWADTITANDKLKNVLNSKIDGLPISKTERFSRAIIQIDNSQRLAENAIDEIESILKKG